MNPAALISVGVPILQAFLQAVGGSGGPTAAQLAALRAQQEAELQRQRLWLIGGGIAVGVLVIAVALRD